MFGKLRITSVFFNVSVILAILVACFSSPASAYAEDQKPESANREEISPQDYLNSDGTLNLDENLSGSFDLQGWDVQMDPTRGPVFHPAQAPLALGLGQWGSLGGGVTISPNSSVKAIAISGTDVYVGGSFTDLNNQDALDYIAKWDGANWSALGTNGSGGGSISSFVNAIVINGTDIYAGGGFTDVNNNGSVLGAADYIAKWNGSNWSALGSNGAGNGSFSGSSQVYAIAVNGSNVYASGGFTNVNNNGSVLNAADYIAKWDGANWSALGSNGSGDGSISSGSQVHAIVTSGSNVYVGGIFTNVNNNGTVLGAADYIAKWDGANWSALSSNGSGEGALNNYVRALAVSGSNIIVGGQFSNINNNGAVLGAADYIAKWDGTDWSALGSNGSGGGSLTSQVLGITVSGTDIYVGGLFGNVNNNGTSLGAADYIAKWDGASWSALGSNGAGNGSLDYYLGAIAVSGSNVYVGGLFSGVNNNGVNTGLSYLALFNGTDWGPISSSLQGALRAEVDAIAVSGTDIYIGGTFTNANNIPEADYIAKWNGTNWSALGSNGAGNGALNQYVSGITISGTNVYVGGNFNDAGNIPEADYVAKWDGTNWSALGSNGAGNGSISSANIFTITSTGSIVYVGGYFEDVNNNGTVLGAADHIVKWDGANWSALGSNGAGSGALNAWVSAIAVSGSNIYVAGVFTDINNDGSVLGAADYIAKWDGTNWSALSSNGAGDGALNGYIHAIAVSGSDIYVGGDFAYVYNNGVIVPSSGIIAKWDGSNWSALGSDGAGGSSLNTQVNAIAVSGSNVYVGGKFTDINNNGTVLGAADYAAKWDGVNWSALGSNGSGNSAIPISTNSQVKAVAIAGDSLYTGGIFFDVNNNGLVLPYGDFIAAYGIDPAPYTTSITRVSPSPTSAVSIDFLVTFSEAVTGVDTGDFTLTTTGVSSPSVSGITGTGNTRTIAVNTGTGNGTVRLNLINNLSIQDLSNNSLSGGEFTSGETYSITKSPIFGDVPYSYWANSFIERLYNAGITGGCSASPLNYCPENLVTRDQMAIFLERGIQGSSFVPPNVSPTFGDTAGNFAEDWIEALKNDGITGGCGNGNYCPTSGVTRAQMAIFLERSMHGSSFVPPNVTPTFGDTAGNFAEDWIEALKNDGITGGCGGGNYCPDDIVTRAQMAVFLVKAFNLP